MMKGPVVVKLGGSLLEWPGLGQRLGAYLDDRRADRVLAIVGGGRAADLVRNLDRVHGLGDERAHHLALRALDLTAHLLAALVPAFLVVEGTGARTLDAAWQAGRIPLLAPRRFLDADDRTAPDPLEHSWHVTTDAIAARVAERVGAAELVLVKSAPLPEGTDRARAARLGLVDRAFPAASDRLERVTYLNLRAPGALPRPLPRTLDGGDDRAGESGIFRHDPVRLPVSSGPRPMLQPVLVPLDRPEVKPRPISPRLRTQLVYFMSAPGTPGVPPLGEDEYWFAAEDVERWLDEGVFHLVSPLDTANMTEVELTEEQETLLGWLHAERVRHVRIAE